MLSNFFNLLAISVSELDPIVPDAPEDHTKEIVIIVLLAAAAIAVILIWAKLDVSEKLRERKKKERGRKPKISAMPSLKDCTKSKEKIKENKILCRRDGEVNTGLCGNAYKRKTYERNTSYLQRTH